jgi:hypothetical protein
MSNDRLLISKQEYLQKRLEVAKTILASVIDKDNLDGTDVKQRENFLYHCVELADGLLEEVGYGLLENTSPREHATPREPRVNKVNEAIREKSKIHKLKDILNSAKDDD